jgi:glycosyltransferase involved in cell wall biosynthesis
MSFYNPKITVLMPVYNGEKHLREAINSILNQTFSDFEFLIINDGSTDASVEIINSYKDSRICLVHNEQNIKLIATLNKGLELARGEYIARFDCDDVSLPERLAKQVEFMDSHPEVGICGTWAETIGDVNGLVWVYPTEPGRIKAQLLFNSCLPHSSVMLRKKVLRHYGLGYNSQYLHAEDWALWQKCSFLVPLSNVPEVLIKYRLSSASVSRQHRSAQQETISRIDDENFARLGIAASERDKQVHRLLGSWSFVKDKQFLEDACSWLSKLHTANTKKALYPVPDFSEVLSVYWLNACNAATNLGFNTYRVFRKFPFLTGITRAQEAKLIIKCLLHRNWTSRSFD